MNLPLLTPAWLRSDVIERARPVVDTDPKLAFMLAEQSVTRWRHDADRLAETLDMGISTEALEAEAVGTRPQIATLRERIEPFCNYIDIAVRFEAQELLAAIDVLDGRFERLIRRALPNAPWRDPAEVAKDLQARRA